MKIRTEKIGRLFRDATIEDIRDVEARNGKTQEMTVSISSEFAVERWFGMEVLDHKPESVDLGWFNSGRAPFLVNHDPDFQAGAFKADAAELGDDRKLRSTIRFSRSARAKEIADDMGDGIRPNTSVGYRVLRYERAPDLEKQNPDTGEPEIAYWRAVRWKPLEGSTVPLPADPTVGTERSNAETWVCEFVDPSETQDGETDTQGSGDTQGQKQEQVIQVRSTAMPEIDIDKEKGDAVAAERKRQKAIREIAAKFHVSKEDLEKYLQDGTPVETVRELVMASWDPTKIQRIDPSIGMREKERRQYSLTRAIRACMDRNWDKAGFEREMSDEARNRARAQGLEDFQGDGFVVPHEVALDMHGQRSRLVPEIRANITATGVGSTEGTEMVGTDLLGEQFIDVLRNRVRVMQAGAQVLTGLVGNIAIPRQTAAIAAGISADETTAFTEGAPTYDQVTCSPKIANGKQPVSQQLLMQGSPSVEAMIRRDLSLAVGLKMDYLALVGSGSSGEPTGLAATSGITSVNFAETTPTWALLVSMETGVSSANADVGDMKWIVHAKGRGKFKTTPKIATYDARMLWDAENREGPLNGYEVLISNQCRANLGTGNAFNEGFFGNWPESFFALWGGLWILVDPFTNAATNLVNIYVRQFFDFALRTPGSFGRYYGLPNT